MRKQVGFTLIELVIVISVLAILSAVAIPQFIDLQSQAKQARADGVAGALASATVINYAACKSGNASGTAVANCTDTEPLVQGFDFTDWTITAAAIANDATATCTITHTDGTSATFSAIGTDCT